MKDIAFILSSLNDSHFRRRVESFIEAGYKVSVYGFKRFGAPIPELPYEYTVLGEIENRKYLSRVWLYYKAIKSIAKKCRGKICFYSSIDIAIFASRLIKEPYIYEVCDLTELYIENSFIRNLLVRENKRIIKKSLFTILTSQGFVDFFNDIPESKIRLLPNKVSNSCPSASIQRQIDLNHVNIGFVGVIRFETTYNFIRGCIENSENIFIHLYGIYSDADIFSRKIQELQTLNPDRIIYHGRFTNPDDLPRIYSEIDMVLSAYTPSGNVIYAEPNKLYEALFFHCPIIVSNGTFLGNKVKQLGVGYTIDAMHQDDIKQFIAELSQKSYDDVYSVCQNIPAEDNVEDFASFFENIKTLTK